MKADERAELLAAPSISHILETLAIFPFLADNSGLPPPRYVQFSDRYL